MKMNLENRTVQETLEELAHINQGRDIGIVAQGDKAFIERRG